MGEARRIISYYQNLTTEQRPPKSIQHSAIKCSAWIDSHGPGQKQEYGTIGFEDHEVER